MILYKYKSLDGDGLLHSIDMLVNERIYFGVADKMNDPEEGSLNADIRTVKESDYSRFLINSELARKLVDRIRFSCFSKSGTNFLLWAHYASGHRGIVFEYEIPSAISGIDIREISYHPKQVSAEQLEQVANETIKPYDVGILQTKRKCWEYEKEVRLYMHDSIHDKYFNIRPRALILGAKHNSVDEVLSKICNMASIKIKYIMPGDDNEYEVFDPAE